MPKISGFDGYFNLFFLFLTKIHKNNRQVLKIAFHGFVWECERNKSKVVKAILFYPLEQPVNSLMLNFGLNLQPLCKHFAKSSKIGFLTPKQPAYCARIISFQF